MNRSPWYIYCLPTVKVGVRQLFITCLLPKVIFHISFLNHYKRLNINNWFNLRLWALNIPRSTYLRQTQTRFLTHLPQPPALGQTSTGWLCCLPVGSWNQDFSLSLRPILKVCKRCAISFASNNWNSLIKAAGMTGWNLPTLPELVCRALVSTLHLVLVMTSRLTRGTCSRTSSME